MKPIPEEEIMRIAERVAAAYCEDDKDDHDVPGLGIRIHVHTTVTGYKEPVYETEVYVLDARTNGCIASADGDTDDLESVEDLVARALRLVGSESASDETGSPEHDVPGGSEDGSGHIMTESEEAQ